MLLALKYSETLRLYDEQLRLGLEKVLNFKMQDEAWGQGCLPVANGGLGIRRATDLSLPAFLSSAHGAQQGMRKLLPQPIFDNEYQARLDAETAWGETFNNNGDAVQPENKNLQASWDSLLCKFKYDQLLESTPAMVEKARIRAVASEHSSDWLNALPVPALGLKLDNSSTRIADGLRLGTPLCEPYRCICGSLVDSSGRHGLSCKKAKGTTARHGHANGLIKRALASAQVPSVLEPPGLTRSDGRKPDGLTLFPWSNGKSVVWDYTCRDTLCNSYVTHTSQEAGKAAEMAEKKNLEHYADLSRQYTIIPVATETMGSWGNMGLKFLKEIGKRIIEQTGEKRSTCYLFQVLSMATQMGNVASIRGSMPDSESMTEIIYL